MNHQCQSPPCSIFLILALFITTLSNCINAQTLKEPPPIANLNSTWVNNSSTVVRDNNSMRLQPILSRGTGNGSTGPWFSCGFYCNTNDKCLFALLLFPNSSLTRDAKLVWSANRNNPVSLKATLEFARDGNLDLNDANGSLVWSTNTSGKSVSSLNLTETGNLVLFDRNNSIVWQSFDHPTDSLLPGQMLVSGQKLISNASSPNWGEGLYSLSIANQELVAHYMYTVDSTTPGQQLYFQSGNGIDVPIDKTGRSYIQYEDGSFGGYNISRASPLTAQFIRLEADGHVKIYEWTKLGWREVRDLLAALLDGSQCLYPMACGNYGICSEGQCTCPKINYFKQVSERQTNLGCSLNTPISCNYSQFHSFVELNYISYSSLSTGISIGETDLVNCKNRCLERCSCKAAVFQYNPWNSTGSCYLLPIVFSFTDSGQSNLTVAYVKVQNPPKKKSKTARIIMESCVGALFGAYFTITNILFFLREKNESKEVADGYLEQLPGTPTRFSYQQLRDLTEDFSKKIGEGGFGTVFKGSYSLFVTR